MPSPEAVILTDFLLAPAALRDVLTLQQFTEIFPKSHRLGPAVKELYQELQRLRNEDLETVRLNIQDEIKKSRTLKRDCARERELDDRRAVAGLDPTILDREEQVSGNNSRRKPHSLQSIHTSIEEACTSIETQLEEMDSELQDALSEVQDAIGELSDLRYGSFQKSVGGGDMGEEVLATLQRLDAACDKPTR